MSEGRDPEDGPDHTRRAGTALAWGLTIGLVLAALGAFVAYRVTGTFLGAVAGWLSVVIVTVFGQFVLVFVGAVRGMRTRD